MPGCHTESKRENKKMANDDEAKVVANSATIVKLIKNLSRDLIPLEKKMDEIKVQRAALRKVFTADSGITMRDFDSMRRLAQIEDDDARKGKLQDMQKVFNALSPGEQMTMQL